jgi:hypothetical protein
MMSEDPRRGSLVGALWFFCALALVALFISAAAQQELTRGHIMLTVLIIGTAIVGTPFILRWADLETQPTKAKRQPIDSILRDMSDEEILELKQRLLDGDFHEADIVGFLGDDGELVQRS